MCGERQNYALENVKICKAGFTRQPVPSSLTLQDGPTTTSEKEMANALIHKFFPDDSTAQDSGKQRNIRAQTAELRPPNTQLDLNFTEHEVDEVIRNLDDSKCPGPDGIDGIIVKRLRKGLPKFWISLFNKRLVLGCFPKEWKRARVTAIPKSDQTKLHSVQGYRGINFLSIPGKCLEKLVIETLNYFLETTGQIPSLQYGFTAGRSTADAIKTVTKGCPQGSVSGPTLWNIIISDLIALLFNAPNLKIVVFADDIMVMKQGPSLPAIFKTLQTTLQTIEDWCKEHKLEISKDKSALMPMFTRNREEFKCHPIIVAWGIKIVSKMRHLGVI